MEANGSRKNEGAYSGHSSAFGTRPPNPPDWNDESIIGHKNQHAPIDKNVTFSWRSRLKAEQSIARILVKDAGSVFSKKHVIADWGHQMSHSVST